MNEGCAELQGKIVLRKVLIADEERVAFLAGRTEPLGIYPSHQRSVFFGLVAISLKS
jgi:hypothetical protein